MTIDETIRVMEFFLHKQCVLGRMKFTPYDDDNLIWHAVNDVFEEWKWYKKQDLIWREDAIREGTIALIDLTDIDVIACEDEVEYRMKQIPKAEYNILKENES